MVSKKILGPQEGMEKGEPQWLAYKDLSISFLDIEKSRDHEDVDEHGWQLYCAVREMPSFSVPFLAIASDALSFPLTIAYAFYLCRENGVPVPPCVEVSSAPSRLSTAADSSSHLTLHLLGAEWDSEGVGSDKWMEIMQLFPGAVARGRSLAMLRVVYSTKRELSCYPMRPFIRCYRCRFDDNCHDRTFAAGGGWTQCVHTRNYTHFRKSKCTLSLDSLKYAHARTPTHACAVNRRSIGRLLSAPPSVVGMVQGKRRHRREQRGQ